MRLYEKLGHFSIMSLKERLKYAQMKARHSDMLRPWYNKWWGILLISLAIIFFILLAVASAYVINQVQYMLNEEAASQPTQQDYQTYLQAIKGDGSNYFTGPAEAPVTIIEFGDFSCPYCQSSAVGLRKIAKDYADNVKIVFRDYPLHDNSIDLALAARCAGEQGKFWEMHDLFYLDSEQTDATGEDLRVIFNNAATTIGLDTVKFTKCLDDRRYILQIKRDYDDGELLSIDGTPTWFINNYMITGDLPENYFREMIDGLLPSN